MISTWGIFWIALFGASVIKCLITHILPLKVKQPSEETWSHLEKLSEVLGKNITVNAIISNTNIKKKKEKVEEKAETQA